MRRAPHLNESPPEQFPIFRCAMSFSGQRSAWNARGLAGGEVSTTEVPLPANGDLTDFRRSSNDTGAARLAS